MRPVLLVLLGFAIVALLLAWTRALAGRRWAAAGNLATGLVVAAVVALLWPVATHLATYERHRPGEVVAELFLEQTGPGRFRATLTRLPQGRMQVLELRGGAWQVEARTLRYVGRAAGLGLEPARRLERLSAGAGTRPDSAPTSTGTFALHASGGLDLWALARDDSRWARVVEARLPRSPWQPLAHGARFELRLGPDGLTARALNAPAETSLAATG
jgi:hypothetical protein